MIKRTLYVNVYQEERCYGGPEEGGWWYSSYTPVDYSTAECSCDLPISEWPIQDDGGDFIGWHAELDTWIGLHNQEVIPHCPCVAKYEELEHKWSGHEDTWYTQILNDESEPRTGESFSSGKIQLRVELMKASYKPEQMPMYS